MTKILKKTEFGNPILRKQAQPLSDAEILSDKIQELIRNMYHTLETKRYGVGLAAPQVGESVALSVIDTKPTPTRPELKRQKLTIINPEICQTYGKKKPMLEGCVSGTELYAKVPRYEKIRLRWQDEVANVHEETFDGFMAHVIQHEFDHLQGILFVDRVKNTRSYITFREYRKSQKTK